MKPVFVSHTGFLHVISYLSLALVVVQTDNGSAGQDPPVEPVVVEEKVPRIAPDQNCDSGQRKVLDIFKDRKLVRTEKGDCVPKSKIK